MNAHFLFIWTTSRRILAGVGGVQYFCRQVNRKKKPDWRAESESVCIFHLLQLPLAADPELLKFRGIMEMVKLVKGCLGERSYKLHKTHES